MTENIDRKPKGEEKSIKNAQSGQKPTSKSETGAPKNFDKSIPSKKASKPKVEKLGWDTPSTPELAKKLKNG